MKLTDKTYRGISVEIHVAENTGYFYAEVDGARYTAETVKGLEEKLLNATKIKNLNLGIEFWRWNDLTETLERGTVTGVHATNRNILTKIGSSKNQEHYYSGSYKNFLRLNEQEREHYVAIRKEAKALEDGIREFERTHGFDPREEVDKAAKGDAA